MNNFESERPDVLERLGSSVRDAMKRLPDLNDNNAISTLEGEGGIVLEQEEEAVVSGMPKTTPDLDAEIARFVGEGGLPNPPRD